MTGQRNHLLPCLILALVLPSSLAWAGAPDIIPPDPLAIEMPAGVNELSPDDPAIKAVIAQVTGGRIPADRGMAANTDGRGNLARRSSRPGIPTEPPITRSPGAKSHLFILPHGMTIVGSSGGSNATAGNNSAHIVTDASGAVHMVWYNSWRGGREGALYRRARFTSDGKVNFETDAISLGVHAGTWSSLPTLAAFGDTVHFAWQAEGTLRYRALTSHGRHLALVR